MWTINNYFYYVKFKLFANYLQLIVTAISHENSNIIIYYKFIYYIIQQIP